MGSKIVYSFIKTLLAKMNMNFQPGYFAILLFLTLSCQNKISPVNKITISEVDSLLSAGLEAYRRDPKDAIFYFRQAAIGYESLDNFKQAGISFLNVAGIFEEHTGQLDSAEYYAFCSLKNFMSLKDSMQIANLYKYYGYLLGVNGKLKEGEFYIDKAIQIYERTDFDEGLAVSKYNQARLAFLQKEYSRSDSLLNEAEVIWMEKQNTSRLFLINLLQMEIGIETKDRESVLKIVHECDSLILTGEVPEQDRNRFMELKTRI